MVEPSQSSSSTMIDTSDKSNKSQTTTVLDSRNYTTASSSKNFTTGRSYQIDSRAPPRAEPSMISSTNDEFTPAAYTKVPETEPVAKTAA